MLSIAFGAVILTTCSSSVFLLKDIRSYQRFNRLVATGADGQNRLVHGIISRDIDTSVKKIVKKDTNKTETVHSEGLNTTTISSIRKVKWADELEVKSNSDKPLSISIKAGPNNVAGSFSITLNEATNIIYDSTKEQMTTSPMTKTVNCTLSKDLHPKMVFGTYLSDDDTFVVKDIASVTNSDALLKNVASNHYGLSAWKVVPNVVILGLSVFLLNTLNNRRNERK